ncbi:MAG: enoyl-CoA hydratase-related protein [Caulobacterales bacterium]|jgi:methylglutaconyl-CoA hydratase
MTLAPDPVLLDVSPEGLAVVTLNRPAKRNAFDEAMIAALADAFETLRAADHVRVVFLRGAGDVFCAGADLEWMRRQGQHSREDNEADARALAGMLKALHDLPQLTVALAHGAAMGGGAGLIAACDVAVALNSTAFRFSEVRLGLTPATISPYVIEAIGARWARALFATGEGFDGRFAEKIGLVQYAVDTEADLESMMKMLAGLAFEAAPGAVADAKRLVRDVAGQPITDGLLRETARRIAERRASAEGKEGVAAFLERRAPSWKNG